MFWSTRTPEFPLMSLLLPFGLFFVLIGLSTWVSYMNYRELEAMRHGQGMTSGTMR